MANKKVKRYEKKVYDRKIIRNMLKRYNGNNKIKNLWHRLRNDGKI